MINEEQIEVLPQLVKIFGSENLEHDISSFTNRYIQNLVTLETNFC